MADPRANSNADRVRNMPYQYGSSRQYRLRRHVIRADIRAAKRQDLKCTPLTERYSIPTQLTPTNRKELYQAISQLKATTPLNRDTRSLFVEVDGAFDRI